MLNNISMAAMGFAAKMNGVLLDASLDVKSMLEADGASEQLSGLTTMVDNYGSSGFSLGQKICVYIAGVACLFVAGKLMLSGGNNQSVAEVKSSILPRVFGGLLAFGVVGAIVFLQSMGANLFSMN